MMTEAEKYNEKVKNELLERFENLKGQHIICSDKIYRLIGLTQSDDWFWVLYDGEETLEVSVLISIVALKGYIKDDDYKYMVRTSTYNHQDVTTNPDNTYYREDTESHIHFKNNILKKHEAELITPLCWDLN